MAPDGSIFITVKGAGVGTIFPGVAGAIGRDVYAFKPREEVDRHLVRYALLHSVNEIKRRAVGDIPGISKNDILDHVIGLPSLKQQRKIAEAIDAHFTRLDAAVSALERVRANLKRYRASVLKAACEGRLVRTEAELARREGRDYEPADVLLERILRERRARWEAEELARLRAQGREPTDDRWKRRYKEPEPPDTSGLPELPEGWVWASVEQLGEIIGGITKNRKRAQLPLKVPYLRVANVYADELRLDDVQEIGVTEAELERVLLRPGDLLVVEGNGSRDQIGRVAVWDGSISTCVHQNHLIKIRLVDVDWASYVLYWLLSPSGRDAIERVASSTSGLYTLSLSKVAAIPVPVPPDAERRRILGEVERRITVLDAVGQELTRQQMQSTRLRQSILKRAFEGRLVPQDPSDEPASVLLERIRAERGSHAGGGKGARGQRATVQVLR